MVSSKITFPENVSTIRIPDCPIRIHEGYSPTICPQQFCVSPYLLTTWSHQNGSLLMMFYLRLYFSTSTGTRGNLHRSREQCFSGVLSVYQCYMSLMWPMHLRRKSASHTADHTLWRHISLSPYPLIHMVSTWQEGSSLQYVG